MPFHRFLVLACAVAAAMPAAAKPAETTWAKPGVTLADYRRDASECANGSGATAVSIRPDTLRHLSQGSVMTLLALVDQFGLAPESGGLARLQGLDQFRSETDIARRSYNFGAEYVSDVRRDVRAELQSSLDACLIGRGYAEVALTPDQGRALSRLKRHSAARAAYLYAIASADAPHAARR